MKSNSKTREIIVCLGIWYLNLWYAASELNCGLEVADLISVLHIVMTCVLLKGNLGYDAI